MLNIKLTLSWNGANFSGYQSQPHAVTVQDTLIQAWKILTGEEAKLCGCSRLDAKVNASFFVLNFHSETNLKEDKIIRALNGILHNQFKAEICVYQCDFVALDFHARYHATGKHYRYCLWHGYKTHALYTPQCWLIHSKNSLENLGSIVKQFEGEHDFAGFRASDCCAKHTIKKIYGAQVFKHHQFPELITIDFYGDGFLKNMIRNMVGTAVQMAIGKLNEDCIQKAFEHKNRKLVGVCAPGAALTLMKVYYNKQEFLDELCQGKNKQ